MTPRQAFVQLDVPNRARHVRSEKPAPNPSWNAIGFPLWLRSSPFSGSDAIRLALSWRSDALGCTPSHALQGKAYDRSGGQILVALDNQCCCLWCDCLPTCGSGPLICRSDIVPPSSHQICLYIVAASSRDGVSRGQQPARILIIN